jgi:type I restriction enzyme S subunit
MQTLKLKKKYERYPEYKDSGVEWLGEIPRGWEAQKILSVFDFPNEKVTEEKHEPLSVTYDGIKKQIENAAKVAEGSLRKLVKIGDIAINGRSDRKGAVGMSEYEGGVSLVYNVLRKRNQNFDSKYFHYVFRSKLFSEEFYRWGRGIVDDLWTTRESEMKKIFISVPPPEQQTKIAKYLNEKTLLIDRIIEKKQKQIELLREKRTAIINQAVTKGLDPNVELVDSGIDWIGKIPRGWKIEKLKNRTAFLNGYSFNSDEYVDDGLPIVRISDVGQEVDLSQVKRVPYALRDKLKKFLIKKNDLLVALTGGTIGKTSIYNSVEEIYLNQRVGVIRPNTGASLVFLKYLLESDIFKKNIEFLCDGGAQPNIGKNEIGNIFFAFPFIKEQERIAEYLNEEMSNLDAAVKHVEQSIKLLQEFKSSLISNVVTGKIKI